MGEQTNIEWADSTWNPWEGCQKVGPGCDHCYAEVRNQRFAGGVNWGPGAPRRRTSAANWAKPIKWAREAEAFAEQHGRRQRVFCASLADVFDNAVDPAWRNDLLNLILLTPELDWLLLTKRIGNVAALVEECGHPCLPRNVWLGATVVTQAEADRDIPKLLSVPATVRFLSMEPLLGPVRLAPYLDRHMLDAGDTGMGEMRPMRLAAIDWVIVGGESGPGARPMHPEWAAALVQECVEAGTPVLFKQWGDWLPVMKVATLKPDGPGTDLRKARQVIIAGTTYEGDSLHHFPDCQPMVRTGKKLAGRLLGGRTYDGFPEVQA
jgi:protein gp37